MLKRLITTAAAILLIVGCADVPTQPVAEDVDLVLSATIIDGVWPGRYEVFRMVINASPDVVDNLWGPGLCAAWYTEIHTWDGTPNNRVISNVPAPYVGEFHVTENKNGANATCNFIDGSGAYEMNAEVGYTQNCELWTADGTYYGGGIGTVTVAANNAKDDSNGGNGMIRCKFKNSDQAPPS